MEERPRVDLAAIIAAHPCASEVDAVEACVGAADRAWARCQAEVRALRACNDAAAKRQQEKEQRAAAAAAGASGGAQKA